MLGILYFLSVTWRMESESVECIRKAFVKEHKSFFVEHLLSTKV